VPHNVGKWIPEVRLDIDDEVNTIVGGDVTVYSHLFKPGKPGLLCPTPEH